MGGSGASACGGAVAAVIWGHSKWQHQGCAAASLPGFGVSGAYAFVKDLGTDLSVLV